MIQLVRSNSPKTTSSLSSFYIRVAETKSINHNLLTGYYFASVWKSWWMSRQSRWKRIGLHWHFRMLQKIVAKPLLQKTINQITFRFSCILSTTHYGKKRPQIRQNRQYRVAHTQLFKFNIVWKQIYFVLNFNWCYTFFSNNIMKIWKILQLLISKHQMNSRFMTEFIPKHIESIKFPMNKLNKEYRR